MVAEHPGNAHAEQTALEASQLLLPVVSAVAEPRSAEGRQCLYFA